MNSTDLGFLSVLIVDDEPSIHETLQEYLNHMGIPKVRTAHNGLMALDALHEDHYDYVFMDLMMPEMDGMEVLKHLSQGGKPASVIVMTGSNRGRQKRRL